MKKSLIPLPFLFFLALTTFAQEVMKVSVTPTPGYSVFHAGMGAIGPEAEDSPFKSELRGVPAKLKNIKRHHFIFDEKQFFYQNFLNEKISKEEFERLKQALKYEPNEKEFSKNSLRASVYIITGEDEKGNRVWLADTDTDLDFSDEKARPLLTYSDPFNFGKYKSFADNAVQIKHQRMRDGKVTEEVFPLAIVAPLEGEHVYFNYPRHYTATVKAGNKAYAIALESNRFLSEDLDDGNNSMVVLTDDIKGKTVDLSVPVRPNQYFNLGEDVYQYLGVDSREKVAKIKRVKDAGSVKSAQVGFPTIDFEGKDYTSGKEVTMKKLKGKYVLLDFWATWCTPCIKEFPRLKALSSHYDKSKFEIIGIIGRSEPKDLAKLIDKHKLTWPQVLSDEIVEKHGVSSYPSTFLISPEGKVIYKDLKGEELEKVLAELIK
ncbi:TlpA family protein disulfide reductase [Pontibacter pamirensis]|uniref:TlpA family protein disulfide reductase n=1 Tax=Pontibacter pamirensis TaxID=2562824 RepID=UPI001389D831|nr:TlpA disulfide reductase family protein [Pontibacter pamirensis]